MLYSIAIVFLLRVTVMICAHTTLEKRELQVMVDGLVWYSPSKDERRHYGSGGVAIIDQWIASHARYFIGKSN